MSSYQKFSLSTFRGKLKDKAYDTLAGANRAIGKMRELSDSERDKARRMAASHFGAEAPAKVTTAAKKEKKVAKKAAKKVKKVAKRVAKAAVAAPKKAAKKITKKVAKKRAKRASSGVMECALSVVHSATTKALTPTPRIFTQQTEEEVAARRSRIIEQMGSVIQTVGQALTSMEAAKKLFPKADIEAGVVAASESMSRAVRVIDREVLSPRLATEKVETKKPSTKEKAAKKSAPKPGKRSKAVEAPAEESEPGNGALDDSDLDEEELAALDDAKAASEKVMSLRKSPKASLLAT